MLFPDGRTDISGQYLVVEPPHCLVFSWRHNRDPRRETRVTVLLRANGATTDMTIVHEGAADPPYRHALSRGWNSVARRLSEQLAASPS